jgi:peptide/nickel transport system permease protein
MVVSSPPAVARTQGIFRRRGSRQIPLRSWRVVVSSATGIVGLVCLVLVLGIAFFGPFLAPYSPYDSVSIPFDSPGPAAWLGTDNLGRDVLSRWLVGGAQVMPLAAIATAMGLILGVPLGLWAAYRSDWVDSVIMRGTDLVLAFPPLIIFLLVIVSLGNGVGPLVVIIGIYHSIRLARLVRTAARSIMVLPYIEASKARGDSVTHILLREVLPNVLSPILVDAGFRLVYSVLTIASLSFLGFGIQPPTADWGLMVAENRPGLQLNVWATVLPALTLAVLSIGVNLVTDASGQSEANLANRATP